MTANFSKKSISITDKTSNNLKHTLYKLYTVHKDLKKALYLKNRRNLIYEESLGITIEIATLSILYAIIN